MANAVEQRAPSVHRPAAPLRDWPGVAVPAALAIAASAPVLVRWPLGHTETVSVDIAHRSIPQIFQLLRHTDAPLGLYYLLLHFWIGLGDSAAIIRLPSLALAVASVAITVLLGRRVFGTAVGVAAGLMLAVLPLVVTSAAEARPYSLMMMLSVLSTLLFLRAVDHGTATTRTLYALVSVLAIYAHLFAVLTVLAHLTALALRGRDAWRPFRYAYAAVAAFALPLLGFVATQQSKEVGWIPPMSLHQITATATQVAGGAGFLLFTVALTGYALTALAQRWARRPHVGQWEQLTIGLCAVVPPVVAVVASLVKPLLLDRYLVGALPPLAIMTMAGAFALPRPALRASALAFVAALMASSVWHMTHRPFRVDDARHAASALAASSQPGDAVTFAPSEVRVLFDYYLHRLPASRQHDVVDIAFQQDAATAHTLYATEIPLAALTTKLATHSRIWIVSNDAVPVRTSNADDSVVAFERLPAFAAYRVTTDLHFGSMHLRLYVKAPSATVQQH